MICPDFTAFVISIVCIKNVHESPIRVDVHGWQGNTEHSNQEGLCYLLACAQCSWHFRLLKVLAASFFNSEKRYQIEKVWPLVLEQESLYQTLHDGSSTVVSVRKVDPHADCGSASAELRI